MSRRREPCSQARELVGEGHYTAACKIFAQSLDLVDGLGTKFNLADCFERQGKLASAWRLFTDVAKEAAQKEQSSPLPGRAN